MSKAVRESEIKEAEKSASPRDSGGGNSLKTAMAGEGNYHKVTQSFRPSNDGLKTFDVALSFLSLAVRLSPTANGG